MQRLLTLALSLFSLSAVAGALNVRDLQSGDRLQGRNQITKRECFIDVTSKEVRKNGTQIVIILDGKEDEEYRLRYRKGILTYEYAAQIYANHDEKSSTITKAQAVLKTGKISDETTFKIVQETYYPKHFVINTLVNCVGLKKG